MAVDLLIGADWREVEVPADAFQGGDEQLDVIALEIVYQVLNAADCLLVIDLFEFGELANIL
jgi:hypothetical protein